MCVCQPVAYSALSPIQLPLASPRNPNVGTGFKVSCQRHIRPIYASERTHPRVRTGRAQERVWYFGVKCLFLARKRFPVSLWQNALTCLCTLPISVNHFGCLCVGVLCIRLVYLSSCYLFTPFIVYVYRNFAYCFVWVWNLVVDRAGGKEAEGVWEHGVKENIWT